MKGNMRNFTFILLLLCIPTLAFAKIEILTLGSFHGNEVQAQNEEEWFGVYRTSNSTYVKKIKLKIKTVHDPVMDANEDQKTGVEVSVEGESPLFLVKGLKLAEGQKIDSFTLPRSELQPQESLSIDFKKFKGKLIAEGKIVHTTESSSESTVVDYKWYLEDGLDKHFLASAKSFDDKNFSILWIGDLNNDGYPDIFADTGHHYNIQVQTLFLSTVKDGKFKINRVATFEITGC